MVIRHLHGVDSTWKRTAPVHETFDEQTVWDGDVEIFNVDHKRAKKAYAWSEADGNFTAVLGIAPATEPQNAVKVSLVAAAKKGKI